MEYLAVCFWDVAQSRTILRIDLLRILLMELGHADHDCDTGCCTLTVHL